jgi:hypothetical protein
MRNMKNWSIEFYICCVIVHLLKNVMRLIALWQDLGQSQLGRVRVLFITSVYSLQAVVLVVVFAFSFCSQFEMEIFLNEQ